MLNDNTPSRRTRNKCTCSLDRGKEPCPNCSQYKLVFLLSHRSAHLKTVDAAGKQNNPVKWSYIKEDHYHPDRIFKNMLLRLRNSPEFKNSNVIQLYRRSGELVASHRP